MHSCDDITRDTMTTCISGLLLPFSPRSETIAVLFTTDVAGFSTENPNVSILLCTGGMLSSSCVTTCNLFTAPNVVTGARRTGSLKVGRIVGVGYVRASASVCVFVCRGTVCRRPSVRPPRFDAPTCWPRTLLPRRIYRGGGASRGGFFFHPVATTLGQAPPTGPLARRHVAKTTSAAATVSARNREIFTHGTDVGRGIFPRPRARLPAHRDAPP